MSSPDNIAVHGVAFGDDDWAVAGTNLTAADFYDGEDTIQSRNFGKGHVVPSLFDILLSTYDSVAVSVVARTILRLMPTTWTENETIQHRADLAALIGADSAAATARLPNTRRDLKLEGRYFSHKRNPLPLAMSWINAGNSQILATTANEDTVGILYYAYPAEGFIPDLGPDGMPRVDCAITRKAAGAAAASADTWDNAFTEILSDDAPGLDPTKEYLLVGMAVGNDDAGDQQMLVRAQSTGWPIWQVAPGSGEGTERTTTWFTRGLLPHPGIARIVVEHIADATNDTPNVDLYFQEHRAAPGGQGIRSFAGTSPIRIPVPQGFARMIGGGY